MSVASTFLNNGSGYRGILIPGSAAGLVMACLLAPLIQSIILQDGGFRAHGQKIDLIQWTDIEGIVAKQPYPHLAMKAEESGAQHMDFWINSGQYIAFKNIQVSDNARFQVGVRIHPQWRPASPLADSDVSFLIVSRFKNSEKKNFVVLKPNDGWRNITVDLSSLSGNSVDILLVPISRSKGVWTLWRDPKIQS